MWCVEGDEPPAGFLDWADDTAALSSAQRVAEAWAIAHEYSAPA